MNDVNRVTTAEVATLHRDDLFKYRIRRVFPFIPTGDRALSFAHRDDEKQRDKLLILMQNNSS